MARKGLKSSLTCLLLWPLVSSILCPIILLVYDMSFNLWLLSTWGIWYLLVHSDTKTFIKAGLCLGLVFLLYDTVRSNLLNTPHHRKLCCLGWHTMNIPSTFRKLVITKGQMSTSSDCQRLSSMTSSVTCARGESGGHPRKCQPSSNCSHTGSVLRVRFDSADACSMGKAAATYTGRLINMHRTRGETSSAF